MQGEPSTSRRARPSCRSSTAVTVPRRRLSGMARAFRQRQGDLDHLLEVVDGDLLVGGVDVRHPVREIQALQAALVEDVGVGPASAQDVARLVAGALECLRREAYG